MHLAYVVLDIASMAVVIMVVGAVGHWCCSSYNDERRNYESLEEPVLVVEGRFDEASYEKLVIKVVGNAEKEEGIENAILAQEVSPDGE